MEVWARSLSETSLPRRSGVGVFVVLLINLNSGSPNFYLLGLCLEVGQNRFPWAFPHSNWLAGFPAVIVIRANPIPHTDIGNVQLHHHLLAGMKYLKAICLFHSDVDVDFTGFFLDFFGLDFTEQGWEAFR